MENANRKPPVINSCAFSRQAVERSPLYIYIREHGLIPEKGILRRVSSKHFKN
jgi:hypothetical protein